MLAEIRTKFLWVLNMSCVELDDNILQEENELSERLAELVGKEKALRAQIHQAEPTINYFEGTWMCVLDVYTACAL